MDAKMASPVAEHRQYLQEEGARRSCEVQVPCERTQAKKGQRVRRTRASFVVHVQSGSPVLPA